jgi:hypothetical protein
MNSPDHTSKPGRRFFGFLVCLVLGLIWIALDLSESGKSPSGSPRPVPPISYLRDVGQVEELGRQFKGILSRVILPDDSSSPTAELPQDFHPDFEGQWGRIQDHIVSQEQDFELRRLTPDSPRHRTSTREFVTSRHDLLRSISAVQRKSVNLFRVLVSEDLGEAYVEAHVEIAGLTVKDQARWEWRATVISKFQRTMDHQWQLSTLREDESTTSIRRLPGFLDVGALTGLSLRESPENLKNARRMVNARKMPSAGGLSVTDFNRDGAPDVLVARKGSATTLFLNDGQGGFLPAPIDALKNRKDAAKFYLWLDLDNDGQDELVSTRFARTPKNGFFMTMYRRDGDQLKKDESSLRFDDEPWLRDLDYQGIVSCDVDGNGYLDLIFIGYTHLESGLRQTNFVKGTDGARNLLFLNYGNFKFVEEGLKRGLKETSYSFVAECYDFDRDGDADLFVGNDYGQNNFYDNDGRGHFTDDKTHPFHRGRGFSMGISMADFDNTGTYAVSLSNMYSHAGNRIVPLADNLSDEMRAILEGYAAGNSLFEFKAGQWTETAVERKVEYAQWAWGNVFFDYDNDRDQDLYVVNGFTSHEDPNAPDF